MGEVEAHHASENFIPDGKGYCVSRSNDFLIFLAVQSTFYYQPVVNIGSDVYREGGGKTNTRPTEALRNFHAIILGEKPENHRIILRGLHIDIVGANFSQHCEKLITIPECFFDRFDIDFYPIGGFSAIQSFKEPAEIFHYLHRIVVLIAELDALAFRRYERIIVTGWNEDDVQAIYPKEVETISSSPAS